MKNIFRKLSFAVQLNPRARATAFACLFCIGLIMGFAVAWELKATKEADAIFGFQKLHPLHNKFTFINPLIGFDMFEKKYSEYTALKNKIQTFMDYPQISKKIQSMSIYFRNLETGDWVGINQNEDYDPASLLKVPVMILYLKHAESDPSILSRTYAYTASDLALLKNAAGADLSTRLVEGRQYTVEELIREMIIRSDNIAKYLLILNSPRNDFEEIYGNLGVQIHKEGNAYTISTKTYSLFFRTLYNSTFLNNEMSEIALKILSEVEFKDGIVAGVDPTIKVAHKFGKYTTIENGRATSAEVHDCGIIYYPKSPYLLCVMTRGNDSKELQGIIQQISRITFDFIREAK